MDLSRLTPEELSRKVDLYQHRVETASDHIRDSGDPIVVSVLRGKLSEYKSGLRLLKEEQARRRTAVPPSSPGSNRPSSGGATKSLANLRFTSSDHVRYQNGIDVSGRNPNCMRAIHIEPNTSGGEGYTVTLYNLDGNHPMWGNNIQMAPKPMRIVRETETEVELRGFGRDPMGSPFSDYGATIHFDGANVSTIVLHMHDRNVDIEYLK